MVAVKYDALMKLQRTRSPPQSGCSSAARLMESLGNDTLRASGSLAGVRVTRPDRG